jgi:hypothetical protein
MSRVIMVSMDEGEVVAKCQAAKVGVSAIERLPGGGTRLVCKSGGGAETMRKKLKSHVIDDEATREAHRPKSPMW